MIVLLILGSIISLYDEQSNMNLWEVGESTIGRVCPVASFVTRTSGFMLPHFPEALFTMGEERLTLEGGWRYSLVGVCHLNPEP